MLYLINFFLLRFHGECPICFKPQWLKRCIRIFLSCDDADTTQLRVLFDRMETELQDAKQQVAYSKQELVDAKLQVAELKMKACESKLELVQANKKIREQAALLDKISMTSKNAPLEINNNVRKKTASTSTIATTAASSALVSAKTSTSTSRAAVAKATVKTAAANVASKAKASSTTAKPLPSVVKLRQRSRLLATHSSDSDTSSVTSGSVYVPPGNLKQKSPIVRKGIVTRSRARTITEADAATPSVSGLTSSATRAPRSVRAGVVGNPFSLHR